jgi:hypothetical protein
MRRLLVMLTALTLSSADPPLEAQVRASEQGVAAQTIDGTTTTVTYSRPVARGRTGLFGSRVHWGEIWTPGANLATKLTVNKDIVIEERPVPKGSYSVWIVVDRGPWEMVLDEDTTLFHTQGPKERPGQIRFPITREKRPFMEVLTWWFPEVKLSGATLAMQWDTVYVPLHLRVTPSYSTAVAWVGARHLAGTYRLQIEPEPPSTDTTLTAPTETEGKTLTFTIRQAGNELRGVMDPPMYLSEDGYRDWILLPAKGGWFRLGRLLNGELIEIFDFVALEFDSQGDQAAGFEMRLTNDQLIGSGKRLRP